MAQKKKDFIKSLLGDDKVLTKTRKRHVLEIFVVANTCNLKITKYMDKTFLCRVRL